MAKPPDDIVKWDRWEKTETEGMVRFVYLGPECPIIPCRVYWGSHGCSRPRGHDGDHWCDCCDCESHPDPDGGCVAGPPYYRDDQTFFYGEDLRPGDPRA